MDLVEAIKSRKSIRGYKPNPVPKEVLKEILEIASRAPSSVNTQPWEFAIVSGKKLEEIKQASMEKAEERPSSDIPPPRGFPEPYDARRRAVVAKLLEIKEINR